MPPPTFDLNDPVLARAAWSRIAEPGDVIAGRLVGALDPCQALIWLHDLARGASRVDPAVHAGLRRAAARWVPRLTGLDPRRELRVLGDVGGRLICPGESQWPAALDDLGDARPHCLWWRGAGPPASWERSVALVGARAASDYGRYVAADLTGYVGTVGFVVVSGGAYGIDAAVHRAALAVGAQTVAVLAGGVDSLYPRGNHDLLRAVGASGGLVAEVPPGSVPSRHRFLQRNRLIAALARATVVVEAAWRSGALNTAAHAAELLRPVGAVPGPVTSPASAGCHRLIREAAAVCVTDGPEVVELAGDLGSDLPAERPPATGPLEELDPVVRRTFEALPARAAADVESVTRCAGLAPGEVVAALGTLELEGLAARGAGGWRRVVSR